MWVRPGSFPGAAVAGRTRRPPTISMSYDHEHSDETFCEVNKSSTSAIADTESAQAKVTKPETRSRKWLEGAPWVVSGRRSGRTQPPTADYLYVV